MFIKRQKQEDKDYRADLRANIKDKANYDIALKKLDVSIGRLAEDELETIQCGFVLSTAKHAIPVSKINEIDYSHHPLINEIQETFKNEVNIERP